MRVELLVVEGVRVEILVLGAGGEGGTPCLEGGEGGTLCLGWVEGGTCLGGGDGGTPCLGGEGETHYFGRDEGGTGVFLSNKPLKKNENHKTYFIIL